MQMGTNEQGETSVLPAARPRLIVVGNLTIDDVVLPDGTTQMSSVGGNSLYTALGARLWQPDIGLVTRRGEDFPSDLTAMLHSLGVATDGVVDIPGPTVRNWVVYESSGERHWIYRTPLERECSYGVYLAWHTVRSKKCKNLYGAWRNRSQSTIGSLFSGLDLTWQRHTSGQPNCLKGRRSWA